MKDFSYLIPTLNHLSSNLTGGIYFVKIGLVQAYLQLVADDKSTTS